MKFWQIIIYLFLLPLSLKAQGEEWPFSIQKKLSSEEILSDSLKYKLRACSGILKWGPGLSLD